MLLQASPNFCSLQDKGAEGGRGEAGGGRTANTIEKPQASLHATITSPCLRHASVTLDNSERKQKTPTAAVPTAAAHSRHLSCYCLLGEVRGPPTAKFSTTPNVYSLQAWGNLKRDRKATDLGREPNATSTFGGAKEK